MFDQSENTQQKEEVGNAANKSIKMYLFGLNPTICAKFQHLRELGVSIIAVRCATAGPFIKPLRFYWAPARENSDIYRTFNRVLPPRRPFHEGIYVDALVSEGIGRALYDTAKPVWRWP